jgi:GT2 family glycosyltransferase
MVKVAVNIVTFNSADDIAACLESLRQQTFRDFRTHVLDNASTDGTVRLLKENRHVDVVLSRSNAGFAKAHNDLIRAFPADYVLVLNPDAVLKPAFLQEIVAALDAREDAASASGKLLRLDGMTIDSTGIVMIRGQRHLDRGAGEPDLGQYDRAEDIFGPSGAAGLYRLKALRDVAVDGEFFDEGFFAYREDADLAWRLRARGWTSIYVPSALALHRRRVTPERRASLPPAINYHSVKNRFLLRLNNMTARQYRKDFWHITARDLLVVGYVFLREWSSMRAFGYLISNFPRLWNKRRIIQSKSRISGPELDRWLYNSVRKTSS